jgi:hypothetical protein
LPTLSIEILSEYIHDTIIPHQVKEQFQVESTEGERYKKTVKDLLQQHGLGKICPSTIYHWLKLLGFKYEPRQKGYYVDGHEKPSTVENQNSFVRWYLTYESQMFRWNQVSEEESKELEKNGVLTPNSGYKYIDNEGKEMVEYHVDSSNAWQEKLTNETWFGGSLSIRRQSKINDLPLVIFGHDECIFKQYHMTTKSWVAPDGSQLILPKDDGLGLMITAF